MDSPWSPWLPCLLPRLIMQQIRLMNQHWMAQDEPRAITWMAQNGPVAFTWMAHDVPLTINFMAQNWAQANSWYDCHDVCKTMRAECRGSYATIVARYWMNGNNRGLSSDKIRCCWLFDIYGISIFPYLYLSLSLSISVYICLSLSIYHFLSLSLSFCWQADEQ